MKMDLELLQAFLNESKTWDVSIPVQGCRPSRPLFDEKVVNAICNSGRTSTRSDAVAIFSETVKNIVAEDPKLKSDLHWLAVSAKEAFFMNSNSRDHAWLDALNRWYYSDFINIKKILSDNIRWLSIMEQYLLREAVKRLELNFEGRTSLLNDVIYSYKRLSWSTYAKKKYSYQCWGDGDVYLHLNWDQQTWADGGFDQTNACIKCLYEEQLVFDDLSHYDVSSLETILGGDALKMLPIWSVSDQAKLKTEYELAVADLSNFRDVVSHSNVGGAMRQNKFNTQLHFGHFEVTVSFSDTGKGVVALKKTKDALGTAAGYGAVAAVIGAVAACPVLIAALPIAAIATGGFGRDKK